MPGFRTLNLQNLISRKIWVTEKFCNFHTLISKLKIRQTKYSQILMNSFTKKLFKNWFSGRKRNVEHWIGHPNFDLINHDIVNPLYIEVDEIYHLASPASPPHYMYNPVKTIKTNTVGAVNALGLAKRVNAKILIASTSEVYGDPEVGIWSQILNKYRPEQTNWDFWL